MKKAVFVLLLVLVVPNALGQDVSHLRDQIESLNQETEDLREERIGLRSEVDSLESLLIEVKASDLVPVDSLVRGVKVRIRRTSSLTESTGLRSEEIRQVEEGEEVKIISYGENSHMRVEIDGERGWLRVLQAFRTTQTRDRLIADAIGVEESQLEEAKEAEDSPNSEAMRVRNEMRSKENEIETISSQIRSNQREVSRIECRIRFNDTTLAISACRGSVAIGMRKAMVREAWGSPQDVNRTRTASGTREQWVYGSIRNRRYVYFDDGVVTGIQD
ncbi:hypothetical protein [Longimonas halophila]|uniref:hypothetical protein n=1 Tax=Longimonas halophila TaxID=1469170 RepID=UPI0011417C23|nr:hypothetical protein [Longimonas halophila]